MTGTEWAGFAVAIMTLTVGFAGFTRWLVKQYLYELRPNGGDSLKDQVNRLERRVDEVIDMLIERK